MLTKENGLGCLHYKHARVEATLLLTNDTYDSDTRSMKHDIRTITHDNSLTEFSRDMNDNDKTSKRKILGHLTLKSILFNIRGKKS